MDNTQALLLKFGFKNFKPLQKEAIDFILADKDVLLISPTGGGKSLVYQMSALLKNGVGIVVSPLLALMNQQVEYLKSIGVKAEFLNSSLNPGEQDDLIWALRNNQVDLLYLSPEKLIQPSVIGFLSYLEVSVCAIDEAHCITQWGDGFRPEYSQLNIIKEHFPNVPVIAMTGTADIETQTEIIKSLSLHSPEVLAESFNRKNIEMMISQKKQSFKQLLYFLVHEVAGESGIIYCRSRKNVEVLSRNLKDLGLTSYFYHSALSAREKENSANSFFADQSAIMVATTAFGMGIDKTNIRFVVHMDLPTSIESYYQEIGRAGRDGLPAKAVLFYGLQDFIKLAQFEKDAAFQRNPVDNVKSTQLFNFLESRGCRRKALLLKFNESIENCGNCDRCKHVSSEQNATVAAQKILSLIYHTKGRVAVSTLIHILHGKITRKVKDIQGMELSLFGKGKELSDIGWKSLIRKLFAEDCLKVSGEFGTEFVLTQKAKPVLRGEIQIIISKDFHLPSMKDATIEPEAAYWIEIMKWYYANSHTSIFSLKQLRTISEDAPKTLASMSRLTGIPISHLNENDAQGLFDILNGKTVSIS
ncbi:RecQ family ATP-dependent DNA helicase [Marinomonas sp. 15G1-11]|uniref:ATP-dependent DNA helicase RecQ n=1 Tax=Marinomonas phaeophyticola TaxID=3004091 RepID=A0ABT4JPM4_9GAMM|nr:RecQ family ATP-dependent DNA helicase [Marinomonas sp. 15G1-11]MCZ2720304.1 RecQ family ATP-dependent DNA helicase [Marinomonas sp. 15G1-11]